MKKLTKTNIQQLKGIRITLNKMADGLDTQRQWKNRYANLLDNVVLILNTVINEH